VAHSSFNAERLVPVHLNVSANRLAGGRSSSLRSARSMRAPTPSEPLIHVSDWNEAGGT
jgi:hypothetical protein